MDCLRIRTLSLAGVAAVLAGLPACSATQTAQAVPVLTRLPQMSSSRTAAGSTFTGVLHGVSATSATDAWAVGTYAPRAAATTR